MWTPNECVTAGATDTPGSANVDDPLLSRGIESGYGRMVNPPRAVSLRSGKTCVQGLFIQVHWALESGFESGQNPGKFDTEIPNYKQFVYDQVRERTGTLQAGDFKWRSRNVCVCGGGGGYG